MKTLAYIAGAVTVAFGILSLEAWLLLVVLGWFGVHALTFWKAVVVVLLISALFGCSSKK
jgi:hypothetical protein